jgi:hypothetical protein
MDTIGKIHVLLDKVYFVSINFYGASYVTLGTTYRINTKHNGEEVNGGRAAHTKRGIFTLIVFVNDCS